MDIINREYLVLKGENNHWAMNIRKEYSAKKRREE